MLQGTPEEEGYRWVIAPVYVLVALVNSLPVHTFSSINVIVEKTFLITSVEVTLNALLFTVAHPLFAFPCNWLLSKYGMRISYFIGAILVVSGVWLRVLIWEGQCILCLIGSGLAAIGNIFVLNTPSKIAFNWFRKDIMPLFIFSGVLANLVSITLGAALPGLFIKADSTQEQIKELLVIEAVIVTIPYIILLIFFREKPNKPPSRAAEVVSRQGPINYSALMKKLFTTKQYLKIMVAMSLNYGTLTAFIIILDQALDGLGYAKSGEVTSYTILAAMLVGIFSNPIFSFLIKRTQAYRAVGALSASGGFFMILLLQFSYYEHVTAPSSIVVLAGCVGFFLIPLPSILISYASEQVFPIDESSSAGYLLAASQTFGFIIGIIAISFIDSNPENSRIVLSVFAGFILLSFLVIMTTRQNLKREKFETEYEETRTKSHLEDSLIVKDRSH